MKHMTVDASPANIGTITDFVNEELESYSCPAKIRIQFDVAVDEIISNISRYAYHPDRGPVEVKVEVLSEPVLSVVITFTDNGVPFDPLSQEDPDITAGAEERRIGGLGIFLVKKTMDSVTYEYKDGQNILRIRKNI